MKRLYKKRTCEKVLLNLQRKEPVKVDLTEAIYMIIASWWQMLPPTIKKCFQKAGFIRRTDRVPADENEPVCVDERFFDLVNNHAVSETHF